MHNIIDVHIHIGHRFEWAQIAETLWTLVPLFQKFLIRRKERYPNSTAMLSNKKGCSEVP